jgi:hypothetical protein
MRSHVNHGVNVGLVVGVTNGWRTDREVVRRTNGTPAKFQKMTMKPHLDKHELL